MPVFEYQCKECSSKYEIYHKSLNSSEKIECPSCGSGNSKKLFSSFAASIENAAGGSCASGNCGIPSAPSCANGMCGLN